MKLVPSPTSRSAARLCSALVVLAWLAACDSGTDPGHDHQDHGTGTCGHVDEVYGCLLQDMHSLDTLATERQGVVQGHLEIQVRSLLHGVHVLLLDSNLQAFAIAESCNVNYMRWSVDDTLIAQVNQEPTQRWYFNVDGRQEGTTMMRFSVWHDQHSHYTSQNIPIVVTPIPPIPSRPAPGS